MTRRLLAEQLVVVPHYFFRKKCLLLFLSEEIMRHDGACPSNTHHLTSSWQNEHFIQKVRWGVLASLQTTCAALFLQKNTITYLLSCCWRFKEAHRRHSEPQVPHSIFWRRKWMMLFFFGRNNEACRHLAKQPEQSLIIISGMQCLHSVWRSNEARRQLSYWWAPHCFSRETCLFFSEEIMRHAGYRPTNRRRLFIPAENTIIFFWRPHEACTLLS